MTPLPLIDRKLTVYEQGLLVRLLSTYCDGSGYETEASGETRPGWRDFERVLGEFWGIKSNANKEVFDVVLRVDKSAIGISIKTKELKRSTALEDLKADGRVYMELCNSPAKMLGAIERGGLKLVELTKDTPAQKIGDLVVQTVMSWHMEAIKFYADTHGLELDLSRSRYVCVSYSGVTKKKPIRSYQIHSFPLIFPQKIKWHVLSKKCLRGVDANHDNAVIFDFYPFSGGQLKYYPRAKDALFASDQIDLLKPPVIETLTDKAKRYWPDYFKKK